VKIGRVACSVEDLQRRDEKAVIRQWHRNMRGRDRDVVQVVLMESNYAPVQSHVAPSGYSVAGKERPQAEEMVSVPVLGPE
jgi:hypothetical protein